MKKNIQDQLNESFKNVQFIAILVATILCFVLYFVVDGLDLCLDLAVGGLILIALFIIGFFNGLRVKNHTDDVKNGQRKYQPYIIDKARFLEECKNGLINSMIEVNGNAYGIEVQPDNFNSENYDNFTCYIDEMEIKGLGNFLNYKLDGTYSLNDLNSVTFLDYNGEDPRKYFEENTI